MAAVVAVAVLAGASGAGAHGVRIAELFPEGSTMKPSVAAPAIWENWAKFVQIADQFTAESATLADVAKTDDPRAARRQFASVAKTCTACHTKFRIER